VTLTNARDNSVSPSRHLDESRDEATHDCPQNAFELRDVDRLELATVCMVTDCIAETKEVFALVENVATFRSLDQFAVEVRGRSSVESRPCSHKSGMSVRRPGRRLTREDSRRKHATFDLKSGGQRQLNLNHVPVVAFLLNNSSGQFQSLHLRHQRINRTSYQSSNSCSIKSISCR
jgi:hypothetical protein